MLWNTFIVSKASSGEIVHLYDRNIEYTVRASYYNAGYFASDAGFYDEYLSYGSYVLFIPDTKSYEEYTVRFKLKDFNSSVVGSGYYFKSANFYMAYFDTFPLYSYNFTSASHSGGFSDEIVFDVIADEGSTFIYCYFSILGSINYLRPSVKAGSSWSDDVARLSITAYDISYEKQVGGDDLLSESKKQTQIQEETKETTKNIFEKISEFFSGFFDGIIQAFLSLFVPEDEFFEDYFQRLYDFFSAKLGALFVPIELISRIWDGISNVSSSPSITFPGVKWDDVYIIEPQEFDFSSLLDEFTGLQDVIYFGTDIVMVAWLIHLFQIKLKEILTE